MKSRLSAFFSGASCLLTNMTHHRGASHKALIGAGLILSLSTVSCDGESIDERGKAFKAPPGEDDLGRVGSQEHRSSQDAVGRRAEGGSEVDEMTPKSPGESAGDLARLVLKGLSHVAAFAGTPLVITGQGFREGMWLDWQPDAPGPVASLKSMELLTAPRRRSDLAIASSGTVARFSMPRDLPAGPVVATIHSAGSSLSVVTASLTSSAAGSPDQDLLSLDNPSPPDIQIRLLNLGVASTDSGGDSASEAPIFTGGPHLICKDQRFRKPTGELVNGSKDCGSKPSSQDPSPTGSGGANSGNVCQRDGEQNCVVAAGFRAAAIERLLPEKIRSGHWIGGVAGQEPVCLKDGGRGCYMSLDNMFAAARLDQFGPEDIREGVVIAGVTGTLMPTPPPPLCGSGSPGLTEGCLVGAGWVGVPRSEIRGADLRQGVVIGGVTGTVVPTPGSCTTDGQMECVVRNTLTAASVSQLLPGNIRQGVSLGGVAGGVVPTPASCTTDGQQSCVAQGAYIALTAAALTPGVIKSGVSLAGVSGAYPSAAFPLAGATSFPDLDLASFDAKIKSTADFEWFDSNGQRYANQGDDDLIPTNLKQGVTVFGSAGVLVGGLPCAADGGIGCVTGPRYVAADTQGFGAWDVRLGRQVAGVSGRLVFYKNMAKIDLYDRLVGTASIDGLDIYDTTDDHANIGQFPTENPGGWPQATGANWQREALTDNGAGGGTAGNGQCDGTEPCLYDDRLTGLTWVRGDGVQRGFEAAITHCEGLVRGGMSDFRLPTQKELLQAYVDGIWSLKGPGQLNIMAFNWSSTTVSYAFDSGWLAYLNYGYSVATLKTSLAANLCVRGI